MPIQFSGHLTQYIAKRGLVARISDIVLSSIALVALSPLFIIVSILIRIETGGKIFSYTPIFDKQDGYFNALLFRTSNIINGQKVPTRVGVLLMNSEVYRLPMLINVLGGDISCAEFFAVDMHAHQNSSMALILGGSRLFWIAKRAFDVVISLMLFPVLAISVIVLSILNPFLNTGSLFFVQERMGKDCRPFNAFKFRSMTEVDQVERGPDDPVERNRITVIGKFIRKCRLDELPQIYNVLRGDMSLIGPRPDYFPHAVSFKTNVRGYTERHIIRPGISGLAQVVLGYTEGTDETLKKVDLDHKYIRAASFTQETLLVYRTFLTVISGVGS